MTLALLAMSHSPLLEHADLDADVTAELDAAFAAGPPDFVHDYDPDIVVNLAPDHYNGFFYNLMPPFCVGYAATSIGDYGSQAGRLDVPEDMARSLAEAVIGDGHRPRGLAGDGGRPRHRPADGDRLRRHHRQAVHPDLHQLRRPALHPGAAGPRSSARPSGGTWPRGTRRCCSSPPAACPTTRRSRGWPPPPRRNERMLMGENQPLPPDAREARQQRVIDAARDFAAGTADIQDLAPEWDRELLRILASGDLTPVDALDPDEMTRIAGNSSHEVRTWIAGYAAMAAAGAYTVQHSYYRPIRELIAGFAMTTVTHD